MATLTSITSLVADAEGEEFRKAPWVYQFGHELHKRRFYEGYGFTRNNHVGIGFMQIEGISPIRFIVSPDGYSSADLDQWLKENQ